MKLKSFFLMLISIWMLVLAGCRESEEGATLILTEEIIYVSGEIVRATGRIIAPGEINIQSHGFEISTSPDFTNTITVELGERKVPGRIIGEYLSLTKESDYFLRAFMVAENETYFGESFPFTTLGVEIDEYSPSYSFSGQTVTITGRNFIDDTRVFFGDQPAEVTGLDFESILTVRSPSPVQGSYEVTLKVVSDGDTLLFDAPYEYAVGKWEEYSAFQNRRQLEKNAYFTGPNSFYLGLGEEGITPVDQIWKYDFPTEQWSEVDFEGQSVKFPVLFEGGFLGGAIFFSQNGVDISTEFWVVNDAGDLELEGSTPANLYNAIAHRIDNKLYLFGGLNNFRTQMYNMYIYDFDSKTWSFNGQSPIAITNDYPHFQFEGKIYIINPDDALVYEFDPAFPDVWNPIARYPSELGVNGIAGVVGEHAYFGVFDNNREMWELDIRTGEWKFKTFFPGFDREVNVGYFSFENKLYLMKTANFFGDEMMLWSFDPFDL